MTGRNLVLLISNKWDISVDFVVRELRERGVDFLRLNTEDLPFSDCAVVLPGGSFVLPVNERVMEVDENLKSVLFRRPGKPFDESEYKGQLDHAGIRYCREQWHALVEGLLSIDNVLWINHPRVNDLMESKIVQLRKAFNAGFRIPRTCVTSNKTRAREFIESCGGRAVAKSLCSSLIEYSDQEFFVFTNFIEDIDDVPVSEFGMAPSIFQEYMDNKVDYRVTVVGAELYAVRIESTQENPVPLDWRTQKKGLKFISSDLPQDVHNRCLKYVSQCGLVFGAIDLVRVRDEFYFLEINPNGEWGWLQEGAGLPIAEAIVDNLVAGHQDREEKC